MPNREKISVTLDPTQVREISDRVGEEYASRSEAVRALIDKGLEHDDLEQENERLRRQLAATNRRVDEHRELVEYVEEQREVEHRREEREQRRAQASVFTRAKWWLTGMPGDENGGREHSDTGSR